MEEKKLEPAKKIGLVAVGVGEGIIKMLHSLGVDEVVEGGQTMNPSTEDLLNACKQVNAAGIIILPNNGNVIMAAEQAKHLCDKPVEIVPTRSVMQAISALIAYSDEGDIAQIAAAMSREMANVAYAEVTYAVRDSSINGLDIKSGDTIGIINGKISLQGASPEIVVMQILEKMQTSEMELITLFYGVEIEENDALILKAKIMGKYPDSEVEIHYGGQPHYSYLLSIE